MTYPQEFSHKQKEDRNVNTHIPSLQIDFPRLFNNDPDYYISMGSSFVRKPNKLILADWSAAGWDPKKIALVKQCIRDLIAPKNGHEVYLWQSGELQKITTKNLDELDSLTLRQAITPEESSHIINTALKQNKGFTKDNTFVLTDHWLERALYPENASIKPKIKISDFIDGFETDVLIELLKKATPPLEEIILDVCSPKAAQLLFLLNTHFPQCKIKPQIHTLILPLDQGNVHVARMVNLVSTNRALYFRDTKKLILSDEVDLTPEIEQLLKQFAAVVSLEEIRIKKEYPQDLISTLDQHNSLATLKILHFASSDVSKEQFIKLLKKSIYIEQLFISQCPNLKELFSDISLKFACLKKVELIGLDLDLVQLRCLLEKAPGIEELWLTINRSTEGVCFGPLQELTQLKILGLSQSNILAEQLIALLEKMPHLENLNLNNCTHLTGDFSGLSKDLTKLKKLSLQSSILTADELTTFLKKTPNIESLDLGGCESLKGDFSKLSSPLSKLKKISGELSNITLDQLATLLEKTPNLEELELADCHYFEGDLSSLRHKLLKLRTINLNYSSVTLKQLSSLLKNTPHIEDLNLASLSDISEDFSALSGAFKHLKTIDLSNSRITLEQLGILLEHTPNIECIDLHDCKNLTGQISKIPQALTKLEKINFRSSNISIEQLSILLEQTPHIETLDLSRCLHLTGDFSKLTQNLTKLKTLSLVASNITMEQLNLLLEKIPNLECLNINHLKNLTGPFFELSMNLTKLKEVNLAGATITSEQFSSLIKRAPALEKLHLNLCNVQAYSEQLTKLTGFKIIALKYTSISSETLMTLLKNNPDLEALELEACRNLKGAFFESLPSLTHCKNINLIYSPCSFNDLRQLPKKTPNIEKLSLAKHDLLNFIHLLDTATPLLHLKKLYTGPDSAIWHYLKKNEALLNKLRQIAPNLDLSKIEECLEKDSSKGDQTFGSGKPINENQKQSLDAETRLDPNLHYNLNRIFYSLEGPIHPEITEYRKEAFDTVALNKEPCKASKAFTLENLSDPQFRPCAPERRTEDVASFGKSLKKTDDHTLVYGKQQLVLHTEWQAVASVSAGEELLCFHTDSPDVEVEWQYSQRDNLYYIKSNKSQIVQLDILLKVPKKQVEVPAEIQEKFQKIMDFFAPPDFGPKALQMPKDLHTGKAYLDAMKEQKTGACRHRTVIFKDLMEAALPDIPVRIIQNDCHAFAEIQISGQWRLCNLGGYPAPMHIIEQPPGGDLQISSQQLTPSGSTATPVPVPQEPVPITRGQKGLVNPYLKRMETWSRAAVHEEITPLAYQQKLLQPDDLVKKTLTGLGSPEAVQAMALSLQKQGQSINRPVYYIHSPKDIVCQSDYIKREGTKGILTRGPGGPLYDFLRAKTDKANPPVLIINYANFTPSELVGLHGLLDPNRVLGGVPVPKETQILGLVNLNAEEVYEGADFYSRFDVRDYRYLKETALPEHFKLPPLPLEKKEEDPKAYSINLFHAADWKSQLLGRWVITAKGFQFEEGLLKKALNSKKTIHIQNGLWEDPEFCFFWQQAEVLGKITENGETINTVGMTLSRSEGYDWSQLKTRVQWQEQTQTKSHLLNPSQLGEFLGGYHYDATKKNLLPFEGLIQQARKKGQHHLKVTVTRSMHEDEWARILSACGSDITLDVTAAPKVELPEALREGYQALEPQKKTWTPSLDATQIIESSDPDTTIARITQKDKESWEVIDLSECQSSDLLILTQPHYDKNKLTLTFSQTQRALLKALEEKKKVILTGRIPEELADALAPLLLERFETPAKAKGRLLLVSQDTSLLSYTRHIQSHAVTLDEKRPFLSTLEPTEEPLSLLQARECFPKGHEGLLHLERDKEPLAAWNPQTCAEENAAFHAQRNQLIQDALFDKKQPSPCVFLAGLSGVGKTTFVTEELMKDKPHRLYREVAQRKQWAMDKSPVPKFLFIDEANLSPRMWSEMEGLYHNKPPKILIDGVIYTLDENHKVIFAGNPLSYGDERRLARFFERHPCAVEFKPLPLSVVYEQILKPVFTKTALKDLAPQLCQPLFEIYSFLCALSTTEILISPRELQMIALLSLSYCKAVPGADPHKVVAHYAYELSKNLVPQGQQEAFDSQFRPKEVLAPQPLPQVLYQLPHFQVTPSRLPVLNILNDLLVLHETRALPEMKHKVLRTGGLGGIILEGDSSVGKSALAVALLRAHGYEQVRGIRAPRHQKKPFYCIDASMTLGQKETVLNLATKYHAPLMVDEFNSSPFMERKLNDFLMQGNLLIATQNPVSFSGRAAPSTALSRRMMSVQVPPYPHEELVKILVGNKTYPPEVLTEFDLLIEAYLIKSKEATDNDYTPGPTLRELLREAKYIKKAHHVLELSEDEEEQLEEDEEQEELSHSRPCSYFIFRTLEALALLGGIALLAAAIALSLGTVAIAVGASLAVTGGVALAYRFFKERQQEEPADEGPALDSPDVGGM